jgi:hypothetical protein
LSKLNSDNKFLEIYADKKIRRSELVTLRKYVIDDKCTKIYHPIFLDERLGIKKIHEELIPTLGDDTYRLSQIKAWLQRFKNGDLS